MQTEPHITFHQLPSSPSLEEEIRREIAELDRLHDRITACRVVISAPHRHQQRALRFTVHIVLSMPGADLEVGNAHAAQPEHEDAHLAVRDAFRAARRRLEDHLERRRAQVRAPVVTAGPGDEPPTA